MFVPAPPAPLLLSVDFHSKFRLDDHGLPRIWSQEKDIRGHYIAARNEVVLDAALCSWDFPQPLLIVA